MMMRVVLLSLLSPPAVVLLAAAAIIIICLDDDGVSAAVTVVAAASFAADNTPSSSRRRRTTPKTTSSSPPDPDILEDLIVEQEETKPGRTNLRFQASTNYATKPFFPAAIGNNDNDSLMIKEFFFRDSTRDMLLAGGGDDNSEKKKKNRIELLANPTDPALYRLWQIEVDKSNRSGFEEPSIEDGEDNDCSSILRVTTNAINFPGLLRLSTCATVGCKKVINNDDNNLPELQITLIKDELQAEGPEPLVWVFNQLTGSGGSRNRKENNNKVRGGPALFGLNIAPPPDSSSSERKTHSTNSIRVETTNDDKMFVFRSVAQLTIDVSFPTLLLRILPVSKAMAERQGSIAIRNVVERDIGPSLEALRNRYIHEMK